MNSLCEGCQSIFSSGDSQRRQLPIRGILKIHQLGESNKRWRQLSTFECKICFLVYEQILDEGVQNLFSSVPDNRPSTLEYRIAPARNGGFTVLFTLSVTDSQSRSHEGVCMLDFLPEQYLQRYLAGRAVDSFDDDVADIVQIRDWIADCDRHHQLCRLRQQMDLSSWCPTRLLDVSYSNEFVRLLIFSNKSEDLQYTTLSHCWGTGRVPPRLTSKTMNELMSGIRIADLPPTFANAIHLTRALEIQYLWIDSLCILQDSDKDWQQQASLMSSVYRCSFVNIAATASSGPFDEFISLASSRDATNIVATSWPEPVRSVKNGRYALWDSRALNREIEHAPLNQRAWVVQERLLSPRQLNMTRGEVVWECCEHTATTSFPRGFPQLGSSGNSAPALKLFGAILESMNQAKTALPGVSRKRFWQRLKIRSKEKSSTRQWHDVKMLEDLVAHFTQALQRTRRRDGDSPLSRMRFDYNKPQRTIHDMTLVAYYGWNEVLGYYSRGALTKSSDKLVAIAGVTGMMEKSIDDRCLWGLWEKQLLVQLLWSSVSHETQDRSMTTRPKPLRAPTWSWISTTASVRAFPYFDHPEHSSFQHSVGLKVFALAKYFSEAGKKRKKAMKSALTDAITIQGCLFIATVETFTGHPRSNSTININESLTPVMVRWDTGEVRLEGHSITCVPIIQTRDEAVIVLCGLLLRKANDQDRDDVYHRVGYFELSKVDNLDYELWVAEHTRPTKLFVI